MERVKSVDDYIGKVLKLQKKYYERNMENSEGRERNVTFFYRGQSSLYGNDGRVFNIVPSLLRNKNLKENEYEIYRDLQRLDVDAFLGQKTFLDIQKEMQHFSEISRIIDITTQALSALFFAVSEANSQEISDPCVFMFAVDNQKIKRPESDGVQIKLGLSTIKNDRRSEIEKAIKKFKNEIRNYSEFFVMNEDWDLSKIKNAEDFQEIKNYRKGKSWKELTGKNFNENWSFEKIICRINSYLKKKPKGLKEYIKAEIRKSVDEPNIGNIIRKYCLEKFNSDENIQKLVYEVRKNDSVLKEIVVPEDIQDIEFVLPNLNNKRIIAQQGAFIVVGLLENEMLYDKLIDNMKLDTECDIERDNLMIIKICPCAAHKIKLELETIGISKAVMYPDIQKIGREYYKTDLYMREEGTVERLIEYDDFC